MEEQTARNKQAEAWGAALLVSAQNMDIPAHSSSVPVSAVGAAAAQQSLILPSVQHDSEAAVGEKRPAPDSAQELPGPSVGVLPLHMIEEETAGEDGDHADETPSSPPCSGHHLSAEQYGMNTPAKAARGASRRGPCVKVPNLNTTRVSAQYSLLHSTLRLTNPLKVISSAWKEHPVHSKDETLQTPGKLSG
eukprot:CAMPEP_0173064908 /NCGR_PEP_ID=MMETSP1102-20130122/5289_1 /TAXON_ID=49646 /ORGANISM="Geminigera sp., Strain Caron Lab Isolate" /LENGTH=191 /DNA_ID=CAMNT_0013932051 /DNA_START=11 /DNA_END=582 /DNA_ORIENTATION=+